MWPAYTLIYQDYQFFVSPPLENYQTLKAYTSCQQLELQLQKLWPLCQLPWCSSCSAAKCLGVSWCCHVLNLTLLPWYCLYTYTVYCTVRCLSPRFQNNTTAQNTRPEVTVEVYYGKTHYFPVHWMTTVSNLYQRGHGYWQVYLLKKDTTIGKRCQLAPPPNWSVSNVTERSLLFS